MSFKDQGKRNDVELIFFEMGFGATLIGIPLLLLASFILLLYVLITRSREGLYMLAGLWGFAIIVAVISGTLGYFSQPIKLSLKDIRGNYKIDARFYPGSEADWQFRKYRFTITDQDSLLFIIMNDDGSVMEQFSKKIMFTSRSPAKWRFEERGGYHVISDHPTLFRSHSRFYYVFQSKYYGNMFFRKVSK